MESVCKVTFNHLYLELLFRFLPQRLLTSCYCRQMGHQVWDGDGGGRERRADHAVCADRNLEIC